MIKRRMLGQQVYGRMAMFGRKGRSIILHELTYSSRENGMCLYEKDETILCYISFIKIFIHSFICKCLQIHISRRKPNYASTVYN